MRKEQGFTLIELLIVLAILGILIGIVAMSIGDLTDTARRRGMMSELGTVFTAIDSWNTVDAIDEPGTTVPTFGESGAPVRLAKDTIDDPHISEQDVSGDYGFIKYLRRDTRYYYWYTAPAPAVGELTPAVTEALIVCSGADPALDSVECLDQNGVPYEVGGGEPE